MIVRKRNINQAGSYKWNQVNRRPKYLRNKSHNPSEMQSTGGSSINRKTPYQPLSGGTLDQSNYDAIPYITI